MDDFFPATRADFKQKAGTVAKVTEEDFKDEFRRRHLESYRSSMDAWKEYEHQLLVHVTNPQLLLFVKDLLLPLEHRINSVDALDRCLRSLRRKHRIAPSKDQMVNALVASVESIADRVRILEVPSIRSAASASQTETASARTVSE